ncbi:hypothetical protein SEA_EJIMIX_142 [Mycobacterium phage Ejimix]|uniref:Uncharacterized protein n=1 Tax=Acinetobacter baumannii TaxID=470 RepID=A0AAJ0QSC0_ACIBA|nr:hypothetical protein [Acinetobacter baumannii]ATN88957.1 hypothetical protein SEA_DMPSTRDIVER_150 [Mycobacterium phage DmpstrDiver]AWH13962.1 hypothetical protein SEA_HALLEY_151 [Mycobacterium phage Halley]AXQ52142.1 hypothetical protein SEA_EJIMIX_142 [Mycobacterium phage Ejimix]QCO93834.1 hypothetical protein SEA_SCHATZIE_145 [Mycobacterium phage Schatzie]QDP43895.1 hypothetical protein SEA_DALLAS_150 [Mycobacterium phage Dallas]
MESCWHCDRDVHEAPLTERVALMYDTHSFDLEYSADEDDSKIVCIGSYTEGPQRASRAWRTGSDITSWKVVYVNGVKQGGAIPLSGAPGPNWYPIGAFVDDDGPSFMHDKGFSLAPWQETLTAGILSSWVAYDEAYKPVECDLPEDIPEIKFGPENWVPPMGYDPYPAQQYWSARQSLPDTSWQDIPLPDMPKSDYKALGEELSEKLNPKWSKI